jgi:hypothetical protein
MNKIRAAFALPCALHKVTMAAMYPVAACHLFGKQRGLETVISFPSQQVAQTDETFCFSRTPIICLCACADIVMLIGIT